MRAPTIELTIDVAARELRTCRTAVAFAFPLDAFAQTCLLEGVDELGYLLDPDDAIAASNPTPTQESAMHADIVVLPGDGIGPKSPPPRSRCCARSRSATATSFSLRRAR